jgi:hypothetical protein
MTKLTIQTTARCEMIDITERVAAAIRETGIKNGICRLFVPHTTAAVTINENADPDVQRDILAALDRIVTGMRRETPPPTSRPPFSGRRKPSSSKRADPFSVRGSPFSSASSTVHGRERSWSDRPPIKVCIRG